jgi:hypothetical protein
LSTVPGIQIDKIVTKAIFYVVPALHDIRKRNEQTYLTTIRSML